MFNRLLPMFFLLMLTDSAFAEKCYLTVAKDNCWTNYSVTIRAQDSVKNVTLITVTIPKGKSWGRESFNCEPSQKIMYLAQFTPAFWANKKDEVYMAQSYLSLPSKMKKDETAWSLQVCFSGNFSGVPLPPTAEGQCQCNFDVIPVIEPEKTLK